MTSKYVHSDLENGLDVIPSCKIGWDIWERVKESIYLRLTFSKKWPMFSKTGQIWDKRCFCCDTLYVCLASSITLKTVLVSGLEHYPI